MEKTIVTAFMVIAGIVTAVLVFGAVYPAILRTRDTMISMESRADDRMRSDIEIIHVAGELDSSGNWQDTNSDGDFDVLAWVKNTGGSRIAALQQLDVFFGAQGNFSRIPYCEEVGGSTPCWDWELENDSEWNPTATLRIAISMPEIAIQGRYFIKVVMPNGLSDESVFSM